MKNRAYPETHMRGTISLENLPMEFCPSVNITNYTDQQIVPVMTYNSSVVRTMQGDLGIQIAADGRVWICIDGIAFLRFSPHKDGKMGKDK